LLLVSLSVIFGRYVSVNPLWVVVIVTVLWGCFWGRDLEFLISKGEHFDRWLRKMDGEMVEEEISDHYEIFFGRIRRWRHRD